MDLTPIDALIAEMQAADATIADATEGWVKDYKDLELIDAGDMVQQERSNYFQERNQLQHEVENAANTLRGTMARLFEHGYPSIPVKRISADAYANLAAQKRSIDAALATVSPTEPTTQVEGEVGPERPTQES